MIQEKIVHVPKFIEKEEIVIKEVIVEVPVIIEVEKIREVPKMVVEEEIVVEAEPEVEAVPDIPSDEEVVVDVSEEEVEEIDIVEEPVIEEEEYVAEEVVEVAEEPEPEPEVVIPEPEPEKVEPVVEKSKSSKKKNKSAKQKAAPVVTTNSVDKLTTDLKNVHLQADEVQQLMDMLLEKQSELEQWQKPNQKSDPMEQMKRRIAEVESQVADERQSAQAFAKKLGESNRELLLERNARQNTQNEAQTRINQQAKEAESMRKRAEEKHIADMHSVNSQMRSMQAMLDEGTNHQHELLRLKEENASLKNVSMMAQQLAEDKQSLMTELTQLQ
jgi:hypothetical protein